MLKKSIILPLLMWSLFSGCEPKLIEPNTSRESYTNYPVKDSTGAEKGNPIPVDRDDLQMYMSITNSQLKDTLTYSGKIQSTQDDTLTIDNRISDPSIYALEYKVYRNGVEYGARFDESRVLLKFFEKGWISQKTNKKTIDGSVQNASVLYKSYNKSAGKWEEQKGTVKYPLVVSFTEERFHAEQEVTNENGSYQIQARVNYMYQGVPYLTVFTSDPFQIGDVTSVPRKQGGTNESNTLELKMAGQTYQR